MAGSSLANYTMTTQHLSLAVLQSRVGRGCWDHSCPATAVQLMQHSAVPVMYVTNLQSISSSNSSSDSVKAEPIVLSCPLYVQQ
jgi:hypothetical protein